MPASFSSPLTTQQRTQLTDALGDTKPASIELLMAFGQNLIDIRNHDHQAEDFFCQNLNSWMGERTAPILRLLLDIEAAADRERTRVISAGAAATRASERADELQTAVQESYFALIGVQLARNAMADDVNNLAREHDPSHLPRALTQLATEWKKTTPLPEKCPSHVPTGRGDDQAHWCALHIGHDVPLHQSTDGHVWSEQDAADRRPAWKITDLSAKSATEALLDAANHYETTDLPDDHVDCFHNGAHWVTTGLRQRAAHISSNTNTQTTEHAEEASDQ